VLPAELYLFIILQENNAILKRKQNSEKTGIPGANSHLRLLYIQVSISQIKAMRAGKQTNRMRIYRYSDPFYLKVFALSMANHRIHTAGRMNYLIVHGIIRIVVVKKIRTWHATWYRIHRRLLIIIPAHASLSHISIHTHIHLYACLYTRTVATIESPRICVSIRYKQTMWSCRAFRSASH